jgi:AcrR family transcriptional regulator
MTMDDIAAEAGIGKPTIHLRYKGKIDVATAALAHINAQKALPTTGESENDLIAQLRFYRDIMGELATCMQMIGTLLAEEQHTPNCWPSSANG